MSNKMRVNITDEIRNDNDDFSSFNFSQFFLQCANTQWPKNALFFFFYDVDYTYYRNYSDAVTGQLHEYILLNLLKIILEFSPDLKYVGFLITRNRIKCNMALLSVKIKQKP